MTTARRLRILAAFILLLSVLPSSKTAQAQEDPEIPVIGKAAPVQFLPASKLTQAMKKTVSRVNQTVLHSLSLLPARSCKDQDPWELRTVSVGLGVSVDAGLGPIVSIEPSAMVYLMYSADDDVVDP